MMIYNLQSFKIVSKDIKFSKIISSKFQTKDWRKSQSWYCSGKRNECEKYQEKTLKDIKLNVDKNKANYFRLNLTTNSIVDIYSLKKQLNKYDWCEMSYDFSENFDYLLETTNNVYLFNLKFICGSGGAQIRSLKEVYHFINAQFKCNCSINNKSVIFINILDGVFCYKNKNKFIHLSNKFKKNNSVHILDMYEFVNKYDSIIKYD